MSDLKLTHLKELESESIYILREVAAQFEKPVLLFSGGKDSIVMAYLAYKAFYPAAIPFPFLHIDTGHNFEETISYRDELVKKLGAKLIVGSVQESIDKGRAVEEYGYNASRNKLQTVTLLDTLEANKFDAALGGARRDEEKARAKERFFSHRDEFGQWDPRISALNFGISLMERNYQVNISVYFLSVTGQRWMCGNISYRKI
jgi:3''-phosphoadenosine 5''-phosphosulfate sulfotransferase (PAPS reductase)/FAD synthetase and related enzymes